ncbi:M23 family metallopeptidase [Trujillonella humicola]|uniref:M23 family metallopeptidase n=1 Tax=Trujillonella humicola TaxID=3383699 RepID=UPI00390653C1
MERISGFVQAAEDELQRLTVEAEATADSLRVAQEALGVAQADAAAATAELQVAQADEQRARGDVVSVARETYMGSDALGAAAALLDSAGPEEFLERSATLDLLGDERAERLSQYEAIRERQERAQQAAGAALAAQDEAAQAAAAADAQAQAQLTAAQQAFDAAEGQKAALEAQLRDAQIRLLAAQGAAQPAATYDEQRRTEIAQERAGLSALVTGRLTSCYGSRSGAQHNGIDIAAPIGTPIYAPEGGVVLHAGPANGFGLAVYIQHPDGTITVYGHINQYFVRAGQQVAAGQQIAAVGNRGQSTGPHLHIETHVGGLYANRVNPAPWLAARGVTLGC